MHRISENFDQLENRNNLTTFDWAKENGVINKSSLVLIDTESFAWQRAIAQPPTLQKIQDLFSSLKSDRTKIVLLNPFCGKKTLKESICDFSRLRSQVNLFDEVSEGWMISYRGKYLVLPKRSMNQWVISPLDYIFRKRLSILSEDPNLEVCSFPTLYSLVISTWLVSMFPALDGKTSLWLRGNVLETIIRTSFLETNLRSLPVLLVSDRFKSNEIMRVETVKQFLGRSEFETCV